MVRLVPRAFAATVALLAAGFSPATASADPVLVFPGMEIRQDNHVCTLGYVDPALKIAFTAGHCRGGGAVTSRDYKVIGHLRAFRDNTPSGSTVATHELIADYEAIVLLLTGIIVNKLGQRFVAEDSYHSRTAGFIMEQPDSAAYLIVDEAHLEHPKMPLVPLIDGWETVVEMEAALGIPPGNLAATLDRYNAYAARGADPDFHKQPEFLAAQDNGPWGAFDMSLGKAMYAGFTLGGLATSVDGQVLRDDGAVVAGLYAVGACASNIAQDGKGYASGTQLGEGSFFGRRAGAHAAARAQGM